MISRRTKVSFMCSFNSRRWSILMQCRPTYLGLDSCSFQLCLNPWEIFSIVSRTFPGTFSPDISLRVYVRLVKTYTYAGMFVRMYIFICVGPMHVCMQQLIYGNM